MGKKLEAWIRAKFSFQIGRHEQLLMQKLSGYPFCSEEFMERTCWTVCPNRSLKPARRRLRTRSYTHTYIYTTGMLVQLYLRITPKLFGKVPAEKMQSSDAGTPLESSWTNTSRASGERRTISSRLSPPSLFTETPSTTRQTLVIDGRAR